MPALPVPFNVGLEQSCFCRRQNVNNGDMSKPIHSFRWPYRARLPLVGLTSFLALSSVLAQKVPVVEKNLANGMRVLLVAREDEPTVSGGWVAHVGSSNERPGI